MPFRILYVGQLNPRKGVDVLLRSLARITEDWALDLVFHVADSRQALESLVNELGIRPRVRFIGQLAPNRLAAAYQDADIVALPSYTEALPSVVSEAMLSGTPVLATDVGGIREQLAGYGVLVPPGDVASTAEGLTKLMKEYESFHSRGLEMSNSAKERFSIDGMIRAHEALYTELQVRKRQRSAFSSWPVSVIGKAATTIAINLKVHQSYRAIRDPGARS